MNQEKKQSCTVINFYNNDKKHGNKQVEQMKKSKVMLEHALKNDCNTYSARGGTFLGSITKYCNQTSLLSFRKTMLGHNNYKHATKHHNCKMFCNILHDADLHS
jgi:hypothetical protein